MQCDPRHIGAPPELRQSVGRTQTAEVDQGGGFRLRTDHRTVPNRAGQGEVDRHERTLVVLELSTKSAFCGEFTPALGSKALSLGSSAHPLLHHYLTVFSNKNCGSDVAGVRRPLSLLTYDAERYNLLLSTHPQAPMTFGTRAMTAACRQIVILVVPMGGSVQRCLLLLLRPVQSGVLISLGHRPEHCTPIRRYTPLCFSADRSSLSAR
jgi:hypothetical protein